MEFYSLVIATFSTTLATIIGTTVALAFGIWFVLLLWNSIEFLGRILEVRMPVRETVII
jgi:ABC-type spermidine/putrescine transport system permease subunit II